MVFRVGRKVILSLGLFCLLVMSAYMVTTKSGPAPAEPTNRETATRASKQTEPGKREQDFFAEYRIERARTRDQQVELLREMLNNPSLDQKSREMAASRLVELSMTLERETKAEALIKARGYEDCVVMVQPSITTVIVPSKASTVPLSEEKELKEQVASIVQCSPDQVCVIPRRS